MVRREEVPSFEDQVRSDTSLNDVGYPEYAVFPPGDSEVLYIIDYVEPGAGENASLGFDVASNPERRVSVDKARDSGALVATPGVAFLDGSIGVLLFSPVYTPGIDPTGLDERRDAFVGVIAGGFRIDELLADMSYPAGVNLVLTDEGVIGDVETVSTVLTTAGSSSPAIEGGLLVQHDIPVADRDWMVTIAETEAGFGAASAWALPRILLVLGLVATAAIAIAGYVIMSSQQKATEKAWRATAHLVEQADELRGARDKALESDELKTSFLANMSHELRTPLNAVIGLSGILANESVGPLNSRQLEYVNTISGSGSHLLELIDDLLDLARIEAGKEELRLGAVDLLAMLSESVEIVQPNFEDGSIELIESPDQPPIIVEADARRLRQVVLNLLSNAVKFTPPEGRVSVEVRRAAGVVEIVVSDTGLGIAPEDLDLIFTPFHQIDSDLARVHGGTGLGLAVSQRIVEMHGGRISAESELGIGSQFRIALPINTAVEEEWYVNPTDPSEPVDLATLARTVVVADDKAVNLSLMSDLLAMKGIEVVGAKNGAEAVRLTRSRMPDLVLIDIQMPVMDGLEATRLLKADLKTGGIPILAVTALAMAEDVNRCLDAGCDHYLAKPFTPVQFETAVRETLKQVAPART